MSQSTTPKSPAPELAHPFASAIDTELPVPCARAHLGFRVLGRAVRRISGPVDRGLAPQRRALAFLGLSAVDLLEAFAFTLSVKAL
jgi:hypothetical protein